MAQEINKLGLHELIEKTKLSDEDIMVIQDEENTKRISFRNLRDSLIDDDELPSTHRIYSSNKLNETIQDFQSRLETGVGKVESDIANITRTYASLKEVDAKIALFAESVPELAEVETIKNSLETMRKRSELITCDDIESGSDEKKIQIRNLSSEVINAITGNTPVTVPSVPQGGWVQEDIADESIIGSKLARQYRYKGHYPEGNINNFVRDGLYLLGSSVTGLPKYDENEDNEDRLLEVINYGPDQNIIQRVYYCFDDEEYVRPVYERKATLSKLHISKFVAKYDITDKFKITRNVLDDNFMNHGIVSSGSVYDLTADGNYLVKKNVKDLPNSNYDFNVSVKKFDTRIEYTAKIVDQSICEIFVSNIYIPNTGLKQKTPWYKTNTVSKSRLDGKNIHLFGDGICFGLGSSNIPTLSYPALLSSKYGLVVSNHALGDATIGEYGDEYLAERSVITQIESANITNGDFAIIFAGSEDYKHGSAKLGSNENKNDKYFKGALNICIEKLLQKNSNIKILVVSPLFRARLDADDFRNSDDTPINELYLRDYSNAMKEVCDYNHIPFLDLHSSCMINKYNYNNYLSDKLYPNDAGHDMIANKIFSALDYFY